MSLDLLPKRRRKRIAVMQPYFFPYAGYFRLFCEVDEFVMLDCVQFPRRGRVHRSEWAQSDGERQWLTLPLARQPRDVRICDIRFADDARTLFEHRLVSLPMFRSAAGPAADRIREYLCDPLAMPLVDYLESGLRVVNAILGIDCIITRSSTLAIDPGLRGQQRILAILHASAATHYLNAPGGRALYTAEAFDEAGIELEFLPDYRGEFMHLLPALLESEPGRIRESIGLLDAR